jgi:hypothetical protein
MYSFDFLKKTVGASHWVQDRFLPISESQERQKGPII